ncbi:MAG: DUF5702 domain-containing protein [Oscillospiraceae bacterium]|nr:DUF5702 domain-containing protein [Oscillospiraceae bacterium]
MRGFLGNSKGALTVFVTMLLIPAILVSGTAVDLARIYTAKSIIQDANQLAANAALSQYDKLLNELYGLFGIMSEDQQLAEMINEYIEVSIFGEDRHEKGLGTFQLFYGSVFGESEISFEENKNLKNPGVLRRQIEEYMKFRGPVVISQEFFGEFEKVMLGEDLEIIKGKMAIDELTGEITEKYRELYIAVIEADKCKSVIGVGSFGSVSASLTAIREQFADLKNCYESWQNAEEDSDEKTKYEEKCYGILQKIRQLTTGGYPRLSNWTDGKRDASDTWIPGHWNTQNTTVVGLVNNIANAKAKAENFKEMFQAVTDIAQEIDVLRFEFKAKIDDLENKLQNGSCDESLKNGILGKTGNPPKSLIERYREAIKWDVGALAQKYQTAGNLYIEEVKNMLDGVKYRDATDDSAGGLSISALSGIDMSIAPQAAHFAGFADVTYHLPKGFIKFSGLEDTGVYVSGWEENGEFFGELQNLQNGAGGKTINFDGSENFESSYAEQKQRDIAENFLKIIEQAYRNQKSEPKGAKYIGGAATFVAMDLSISDIFELYNQTLDEGIIDVFADPEKSLKEAAEYILLLAYDTSIFSNYITSKPGENAAEKSISGVPFGTSVNYFYQSEWEYIYNGSDSAEENLDAVAKLLFIIRLICNYVSVFEISEITDIVSSIQEAFSFPLLGVELGEIARLALISAESVADLAALRSGHKVPLTKKDNEWVCLPGPNLADITKNANGDYYKNTNGITYSKYMIYFLTAGQTLKEGDLLLERSAQLIEWNMINYKNKINADETKMSEELKKAGRFSLEKRNTDFQITTIVDMRMLFLSMPFAQKGLNGVVPPKTMRFAVTDCRGY